MTPNPQALRQRRAINKLSRPSVADELAAALKGAERVVYLDRLNAAFHAYNPEDECPAIAAKDPLLRKCRAALQRYNTEKKT